MEPEDQERTEMDLYEYMASRGLTKETVERMKAEKIDAAVLVMMDDVPLREFVPLLGDRIAIRNFCTNMKRQTVSSDNESCSSGARRDTLLHKLRHKLGLKKKDSNEENASLKSIRLKGNQNASKDNRKTDVGWIDFDFTTDNYKQVRKPTGGGTRPLSLSKNMGYAELLETAKGLFFKDGVSSKGNECDFEFDLCDFRQQPLDQSATIGELYNETKMPVLRFYLRTKAKVLSGDKAKVLSGDKAKAKKKKKRKMTVWDSDSSEELNLESTCFYEPLEIPGNVVDIETLSSSPELPHGLVQHSLAWSGESDTPTVACSSSDASQSLLQQEQVGTPISDTATQSPLQLEQVDTPTVLFGPLDSPNHHSQLDATIPLSPDNQDLFCTTSARQSQAYNILIIRRGAILEDMINSFSQKEIMDEKISVHMVLPNGEIEAGQGSGVYLDALTQFWEELYERLTVGDIQKVPFIRHDYKEKEWQAVGRILAKGWLDHRYFPLSLSPIFAESAIFGSAPTDTDTKSAFMDYVPEVERTVFSSALEEFPMDTEELVEILGEYDCRTVVNKDNLPKILSEMGFKELFQKPKCVADFMQPVLTPIRNIFTKAEFLSLYEELRPTSRKVISKLVFPPECNANEATIATYLKRYVRSLNEGMLKRFLRFCTASDILHEKTITIMFTGLDGFQRRPIAHTCGNVLEVPATYESFVDFRQEFNEVLQSGVWVMDVM